MFHPDGPTLLELVRQALSSTQRGYDMIAPKFDRTPFRTPDAILEVMARFIGAPRSIGAALDVCCGTGAAMGMLRPLCRDRVVGIDFSAGMLAEAERRVHAAPGDARVELVRGDALAMTFDAEFDVVTSVGAFGHVLAADEDRFVAGIARALVRGGRFVFATSTMPPALSRASIVSRGFNGVMRVRNAIVRPQFVMYYLTFLWPDVLPLLERNGLSVEMHGDVFPRPFERGVIVVATRRA